MAKDIRWEEHVKKPSKLRVSTSLGWSARPLHVTSLSSSCDLPLWDSCFDFLCFDIASTIVVLKLVDQSCKNSIVYGHVSLALDVLIAAQEENREWWPLSGCLDGQLKVNSDWKIVEID